MVGMRYLIETRPFYSYFEAALAPDGDEVTVAEARRMFDDHVAGCLRLIAEGQMRGVVRDDDAPLRLAHTIVGAISYNLFAYEDGQLTGSVDALVQSVGDFVLRSLAANDQVVADIKARLAAEGAERGTAARAPLTPTASFGD
jgi:hypothetical protein